MARKNPRRDRDAPKTMDELHGGLQDYPEDMLNNVEAYYIYREPEKYSRQKIEKLLGNQRNPQGDKFTQKYVDHAIEHIEQQISEQYRELERKAREDFEKARVEAEERGGRPQYRREAVYPQLSIAVVTIKGQRYKFWRNPETGRFASPKPEQIPERAIPPRELERKKQ